MPPHLVLKTQHLIHMKKESLIDGVICKTEFKNTNLVSDSSVLPDYTVLAISILKSLLILLIFNIQKFYEKSQTKNFLEEHPQLVLRLYY